MSKFGAFDQTNGPIQFYRGGNGGDGYQLPVTDTTGRSASDPGAPADSASTPAGTIPSGSGLPSGQGDTNNKTDVFGNPILGTYKGNAADAFQQIYGHKSGYGPTLGTYKGGAGDALKAMGMQPTAWLAEGGVVPDGSGEDDQDQDGDTSDSSDPMDVINQALTYGRKKNGIPDTIFGGQPSQEPNQQQNFADGGGVLPEQGQTQGGPDRARMTRYLMGADAVSPEQAMAMEAKVDPQGQMNESQRKFAAVASAGSPQAAWGLMQHYRQRFNALNAFAKAAAQGSPNRPPNLAAAADAATRAYANIPDGKHLTFQPTGDGVNVVVQPLTQSSGQSNPGQQFASGGAVGGGTGIDRFLNWWSSWNKNLPKSEANDGNPDYSNMSQEQVNASRQMQPGAMEYESGASGVLPTDAQSHFYNQEMQGGQPNEIDQPQMTNNRAGAYYTPSGVLPPRSAQDPTQGQYFADGGAVDDEDQGVLPQDQNQDTAYNDYDAQSQPGDIQAGPGAGEFAQGAEDIYNRLKKTGGEVVNAAKQQWHDIRNARTPEPIHLSLPQFVKWLSGSGQADEVLDKGADTTLQAATAGEDPGVAMGNDSVSQAATDPGVNMGAPAQAQQQAADEQGWQRAQAMADAAAPEAQQAKGEKGFMPWAPAGTDPQIVEQAHQMFPWLSQNRQRLEWIAAQNAAKAGLQNKLDVENLKGKYGVQTWGARGQTALQKQAMADETKMGVAKLTQQAANVRNALTNMTRQQMAQLGATTRLQASQMGMIRSMVGNASMWTSDPTKIAQAVATEMKGLDPSVNPQDVAHAAFQMFNFAQKTAPFRGSVGAGQVASGGNNPVGSGQVNSGIDPRDVQWLMKNPAARAAQFDQHYGAGAAQHYLGRH